jgi:hypothetical protein
MRHLITKITTAFVLIFITVLTVLYSEGWRINYLSSFTDIQNTTDNDTILKTGMIAVRSIPDGAKVYVNDQLITATDDTITNLNPDKYTIKVEKEGYEVWAKEINVYSDLVTDITAVLVLQSPKLEPLTSLDVKTFSLSNNQNNIVFTSGNSTQPGLWILPLNRTGINLFRNEAQVIAQDTATAKSSMAVDVKWSIDDENIIMQNPEATYTIFDISSDRITNSTMAKDLAQFEKEKNEEWANDFLEAKTLIVEGQKAPEYILQEMPTTMGNWAPDNEKFFMIRENKLVVYNSETPLPVGEKRIYETIPNLDPTNTKVYWYSDSYHFIVVERDREKGNYYTISLLRIDGTNKTAIYSGTLASDKAYPSPAGDKIIVLTSLKENNATNLYSIGLR